MWKILIVISVILAPGTPPRVGAIGMQEKSYANEAQCKAAENEKEFANTANKMAKYLSKKLGVTGVIITTKCVDTSKKPDAPKGESI